MSTETLSRSKSARTPRKLLTDAEIATYLEDGVVKPSYRLSDEDLAQYRSLVDRLVADNPHITGVPYTHMHAPGYSIQNLNLPGNEWFEFMTKPDLVDIAEQLMGPDLVLWSSALFYKRARTGGKVNYHRDAEYYPIEPLVTPNFWIALTDSTVENGCVHFVPGSHKSKESGKHLIKPEDEGREDILVAMQLEDADKYAALAVPLELKAGEMYISDPYIVHGSQPNTSDKDRIGMSVHFFPATSRYKHSEAQSNNSGSKFTVFTGRPLFLVRGEDRAGNDYSIGHKTENGGIQNIY